MTNFVKSVEYIEITLAATVLTGSTNLTKSQTVADCVPIVTINQDASVGEVADDFHCDVFIEAGPKVTATRIGSLGALVIGIHVIEFDTTGDVSVQSGTFTTTANTHNQTITAVVIAKAFAVITWKMDSGDDAWENRSPRNRITTTTNLALTRFSSPGTMTGHYYVIDTSGTDFSVQHIATTAFGSTDGTITITITAVTLAKTFVLISHETRTSQSRLTHGGWVGDLQDTTTARCRRGFNAFADTPTVAGTGDLEMHIIEAGGTEFTVEHKDMDWGDSLTEAVTITEIDQAAAILVAGGLNGVMSSKQTAIDGGGHTLKFTSDTEATGTRAENTTNDGVTTIQVIEFAGLAAAGFVPYPNPRYALSGGMQPMSGGV